VKGPRYFEDKGNKGGKRYSADQEERQAYLSCQYRRGLREEGVQRK